MILDNNTEEMNDMTKIMTPAEFATEVDSDGRTVRKFLRSITPKDEQPGKGSRWAIPANAKELNKLRKQFSEWTAKQAADAADRAAKKAAELEVEDDTVLDD